jgi:bacteriocin-like protein
MEKKRKVVQNVGEELNEAELETIVGGVGPGLYMQNAGFGCIPANINTSAQPVHADVTKPPTTGGAAQGGIPLGF